MLITGHEGFIGRALFRKDRDTGYDILNGDDIKDRAKLQDTIETSGQKVIANLAAISGVMDCYNNPIEAVYTNTAGAVNVLEVARQTYATKVILCSSGAVASLKSPYAASKHSMEAFGLAYMRSYGLSVVSMRFSNIYGAGSIDKTSVVAQFCKQALTTGRLIVNGDGSQTRDFVFLDDVVEAIETIAETPAAMTPPIVQVNGGNQVSINEIAEIVKGLAFDYCDWPIEIVHTEARPGDVQSNEFSRDYHTLTGTTDIREGISKTFDYFLKIRDQLGTREAS